MATKLIVGCGYLGKRLALRWRDEGHTVHATTRSATRAAEWQTLGFQPIVCDVCEPHTLQSLPQVETVVYAVGFDRSAGRPMREVYVQGLRNVRDALNAQSVPPRFILVSSVSVYGQTDGSEVDESSATEPVEESGKIVLDAEKELFLPSVGQAFQPDRRNVRLESLTYRGEGVRVTILRFAGIYGPGRLLRAQSLLAGEAVPSDPDRWLNLIHVNDGVRAVIAAESAPVGVCNVADGHPVRRREFFTFLAQLIGAPEPRFQPTPETVNRRVSNRRMLEVLQCSLQYPDYRQGLSASYP